MAWKGHSDGQNVKGGSDPLTHSLLHFTNIEHLPSVAKRTVKETVEPAADKFVRASGNGRRDGRKSANSKMNMVE